MTMKAGIEILKLYARLSRERKDIRRKCLEVYQRRLKVNFIRFIRRSSKEFRRLELTVYNHMYTRY
jgi:hypothetical protein